MKEYYNKKETFRQFYETSGKFYWRTICLLPDGTENIVGASHRGFDTKKERLSNYRFNVISGWTED